MELEVEPQYLVISSPVSTGTQAAQDVVASFGGRVIDAQPISHVPGHWVLRLEATVSQATAAQGQLRADSRFDSASTAFRIRGGTNPMLPVNRVGVRFRDGVTRDEIDSMNAALGTRIVREPRPDSGFVEYWIAYPRGAAGDPLGIAATYYQHPLVRYAHPDMIAGARPFFVPTDSFYPHQYYLKNTAVFNGVRVDINVEPAWDVETTKGCGVPSSGCQNIAVIDDGVQASHPDFGGQVDFGYDVFGNNSIGCFGCANNPSNEPSHGTHVAGLIIGQHDGTGIAGVAPGAWIVPVRIIRPEAPGASPLQIADGIRFAWGPIGRAAVLNNSWGYPPEYPGDDPTTNAINDGVAQGRNGRGAVFVFAAGNFSDRDASFIAAVAYPARLGNVIAVGAINRNGLITNYSPEGPEIDLVAPTSHRVPQQGQFCVVGDVVTTSLTGNRLCNDGPDQNNDYTQTFSGTSAAAPQVAGAVALLLAKEPELSIFAVSNRVKGQADSWGPSTLFGAGKLNTYRTLVPPVPPVSANIDGPTRVQPFSQCLYQAQASGGTPPYRYAWKADGAPVGDDSPFYRHNAGTSSFTLEVAATDAAGSTGSNILEVTVNSGAPECLDTR